ncbi:MAG: acyl-CoA dehydrogenase family protein [Deltaproteobacteria bacterium]|nr:acyl-CoA dehydrogenase family protein [Deltaproteobacteria bacterium]MBW1908756.1 acyl-CoA dehydrogenase family protein [Deltaproteobacteria bacterium]MBW2034635.1 acyl-CoA dehydrogenase family protein [Deltaproteobacteria bacterium]MBW2114992.1 acyl-CoA dehydrogenase family protein [Deltaproteobacteria bacterium]
MHLEPSMKQAVIRRTVRKFAETRLAPVAVEMDRTGLFPWDIAQEMADLNYFGLEIPAQYGGAGLETISYAIVIEEISRVNAAMGLCVAVHNGVSASPVYVFGTEKQRERFLVPLATGKKIGTFCLTEPNAGSDASSLETSAIRDGDNYILNGNKVFVTNGGISGINLVFAGIQTGEKGKKFSVCIVESEREGLEKGPTEELMGMRGNPVCPIVLHDCRIPLENLLGEEGEGLKIALTTLNGGRIGIAAQALGIAQGSLDVSLKYAKERNQFGKSISEFGAIQDFLADMATRIEAARLLIYRASDLKDKGINHVRESAMAKVYASEVAVDATRMGVQIHGGYGYTKAYPIERFYRDAKVCEIYEGTSEIQRMVIAKSLLNE